MQKLENGRRGVAADVRKLLRSVPNSKTIKVKGGAAQESGLPDFFFTCAAIFGRAVWVECKAPGEEPRKLQGYKLDELRRAGAVALSVSSAAQLEAALKQVGALPTEYVLTRRDPFTSVAEAS